MVCFLFCHWELSISALRNKKLLLLLNFLSTEKLGMDSMVQPNKVILIGRDVLYNIYVEDIIRNNVKQQYRQ